MAQFLNFHTHHPDCRPEVAYVLSMEPSAFLKSDRDDAFVSIGHHPWNVGSLSKMELVNMAQVLQLKQVVAVGEIGLDKLCDSSFLLQTELFKSQLRMAACVQKAVVVHCVKAWDELLRELLSVNNLPLVVVHGFRGKPQLAKQLLNHGVLLSVGPKFNPETLKILPVGSFFLETDDDSGSDIEQLYGVVAELKNVSVESLKDEIWTLFEKIRALSANNYL